MTADTPRTDERAGLSEVESPFVATAADWHFLASALAAAVARAEALRAEVVEALDSLDLMCQDEDRHGSSIRAHEVRGAVAGLRAALADVPTSAPNGEAP